MIPGIIITCLTFPGVMVHEFGHQVFCRLTATQVQEVCYFCFDDPAGYVIHARPVSIWKHMLIGIGPFIVNSILGFVLGLVATRHLWELDTTGFAGGVLGWLAVSVAMHSFPSTGDAESIWQALWREKAPLPARVVGAPLVTLIYMGAVGSVLWLDVLYGVSVALVLPRALLG